MSLQSNLFCMQNKNSDKKLDNKSMAYKEKKFKTYKTEKDGVTLKKGKDGFPEYTLAQKRALNVFNREFKKYWEESRILCTQRERDCQESYHESAFFKFNGIDKETFHDGNRQ